MRKNKVIRWATAGVVAAVSVTGCAAQQTPAQSGGSGGEIKIGASLELSGPTASIGKSYQNALELKVKQINDSHVLGNRTLSLVIRDNQTKPDEAVRVVNDLINNEHVPVVIQGGASANAVATDKTLESKKIPTIALASSSAITTPVSAHPYAFKISPDPDQDAVVLVDELKREGVHSIGLLNVNNVYGQEGRKAVSDEAAKQGIQVVDTEQFGETDRDMSVQLRNIAAKGPQSMVVWAVNPAASTAVQEARGIGFNGGIYLDAGAGAELYLQGAGAAAEGTHMVFPASLAAPDIKSTDAEATAQKQWYSAYTAAYGGFSGFSVFAADALQMIANAIQQTNGTDPVALRNAIENMSLDGVSGPIKNSPQNHSGLQASALAVLVVKGGQWHLPE